MFDRSRATTLDVAGFVDSTYTGISGYIFTMCTRAISWKASFQSIAAPSTTEAMYVDATEGVKEVTWLRGLVT